MEMVNFKGTYLDSRIYHDNIGYVARFWIYQLTFVHKHTLIVQEIASGIINNIL